MKQLTEKVIRIAPESVVEMMEILKSADIDQIGCEADLLMKYGIQNLSQYGGMWLDRGQDWILPIEYSDGHIFVNGNKHSTSDIVTVTSGTPDKKTRKRGNNLFINFDDGDVFFIFYPER